MKKSITSILALALIAMQVVSCQPDPGPQPTTPAPASPSNPSPTLSDTVTALIGIWYWDSIVHYSAGVRTLAQVSTSAGGTGPILDQANKITSIKYNGQGNGSAIGYTNPCESINNYVPGGGGTVVSWYMLRQYPLNRLVGYGYIAGNIYQLSSNRLVVTDWSGAGTKNGAFYYHHK